VSTCARTVTLGACPPAVGRVGGTAKARPDIPGLRDTSRIDEGSTLILLRRANVARPAASPTTVGRGWPRAIRPLRGPGGLQIDGRSSKKV
jgi:hypothetical protein